MRDPPIRGAGADNVVVVDNRDDIRDFLASRRARGGVSENVLEALARALQLDEAERAHRFDLARAGEARSFGLVAPCW